MLLSRRPGAGAREPRSVAVRATSPTEAATLVASVEDFVCAVARRFARGARLGEADFEDLAAEGRIGALVAARRYDPGRGASYLTFASFHILEAMQRWMSANERIVRVPTRKHRRDVRAGVPRDERLDAPLQADIDETQLARLPSDAPSPESVALRREDERRLSLAIALARLDEREIRVVIGLLAGESRPEIGRTLRRHNGDRERPLKKERVRQIEDGAIARLADAMLRVFGEDRAKWPIRAAMTMLRKG